MAIGGIPATLTVGGVVPKPEVYGFQSEASIVGNMIANVQAIERTAGTGIYLDGPDTSGYTHAQKQALSLRIYRDYWDPKYVSESSAINQKWATFIQPKKHIPFRSKW